MNVTIRVVVTNFERQQKELFTKMVSLPAVPRVGDLLEINARSYEVILVRWDCDKSSVTVRVE